MWYATQLYTDKLSYSLDTCLNENPPPIHCHNESINKVCACSLECEYVMHSSTPNYTNNVCC